MRRSFHTHRLAAAAVIAGGALGLLAGVPASVQADVGITEFPVTGGSLPEKITFGPDGNLWYTELTGAVGELSPQGQFLGDFPTLSAGSNPEGIVSGPDGQLWLAEYGSSGTGDKLGQLTTTGVKHELTIAANAGPANMVVGPDGNLWFTESNIDKIGRMTPGGSFQDFGPLPHAGSTPWGIAVGPDGNLWFTELNGNRIGRISTSGALLGEIDVPTPNSVPHGIITGPDGHIWFTEGPTSKLARVESNGSVTEFPLAPGKDPVELADGPDGNLWFTEFFGQAVGRITPAGEITEFPTPTAKSFPWGITAGQNCDLWFTERQVAKIGHLTGLCPAPPAPPAPTQADSTPPIDTTTPALTLTAPKKESVRKGHLYLFATSNKFVTGAAKGKVSVPKPAKSYRLRPTSKTVAANSRTKITLKMPAKTVRAVRTALARHERVKATLVVRIKDSAGSTTSKQLKVRLTK